jgi:hypothetical protein
MTRGRQIRRFLSAKGALENDGRGVVQFEIEWPSAAKQAAEKLGC